jgi:hypothetical protein
MSTKILVAIALLAMVSPSMQDVVRAAAPVVVEPTAAAWPWQGGWGNNWWPGDWNRDGVVDWRDSWAWGGVRGDWDPAWGNWNGWNGGAWDPAWGGRWDPAWGRGWAPGAAVAEPVVTRRLGEKVVAAPVVREVAAPAWGGALPAWGGAWDPAWGNWNGWNGVGTWDPAWGNWNGWNGGAWDPAWGNWNGWNGVGTWDPAWGNWNGWNGGAWDPAWGTWNGWNGAGARVREVPATVATTKTTKAADKKSK